MAGESSTEQPAAINESGSLAQAPNEATALIPGGSAEAKSQTKRTVLRWIAAVSLVSLIGVVLVIVLTNQLANRDNNFTDKCVSSYDSFVDYFPEKVTANIAAGFVVTYSKNYKIVANLFSLETFVLVQCGTPTPGNTPENAKYLEVPSQALALQQINHLTFIELLGRRSGIKYLHQPQDTSSACVMRLFGEGQIQTLSSDPVERASQLDAVEILFGTDVDDPSTVKDISVSIPEEQTLLQMSEWIKYYAVFLNEERKADTLFEQIQSNYNCLKNNAAYLYPTAETHPVVAWVSYAETDGIPSWTISVTNWRTSAVADAGAFMLAPYRRTYDNITELHQVLSDVDILIEDSGAIREYSAFLTAYGLTEVSLLPFIAQNGVYSIDLTQSINGAADWYQSLYAEADLLLQDLISVSHGDYPVKFERQYLKSLSNGESPQLIDGSMCSSNDAKGASSLRSVKCSSLLPSAGASRMR